MQTNPCVSVVVPLYNKGPYIARTLNSILSQTFADFELLVIDDGSTDDGPEVVEGFSDARLMLRKQQNKGPGAARNAGLKLARGKYIAFMDADDEWLPTFLERGVQYLAAADMDLATVTFGYREPERTDAQLKVLWDNKAVLDGIYRVDASTSPERFDAILAFMSPCSTVARTEIIRRYGGFFDHYRCLYAEDAYLWLKVLLNEKVAVSREPLAIFHRKASSLSGNLKEPRPVEPFLESPAEIYAACPADKRELLSKLLSLRAARTAYYYMIHGCCRDARGLLEQFCNVHRPPVFKRLAMAAPCAFILPYAFRLKTILRNH